MITAMGKHQQSAFRVDYACLGAATLLKLGLSTNEVQAVPTPLTQRDRTYAMALSLKHWLREHGMAPTKGNLITSGPHARRSRLMFEKALGRDCPVGVLAVLSERPTGLDRCGLAVLVDAAHAASWMLAASRRDL